MLALRLRGRLHLERDRPVPEPATGEALVRVLQAGVCGTDLQLVQGYKGFDGVPGHEFVGRVERADDRPELVGRRVVGEVNAVCGVCPTCAAGHRTHCPRRTALGIFGRDGAFAEFLTLPTENLHPVPDELTDDQAVFVEPLAAACRILEQLELTPETRVVVVGDGRLGLLCAQVLATTGCDLTVLGRHARKLALLRSVGVPTATRPALVPAAADVVVEATGTQSGLATAVELVRPLGTIVLKSTHAPTAGDEGPDLSPIVVRELTVVGSRCGPFDRALELLAAGTIDVEPLIDARYPLERGVDAFQHAARRGTLKVLIEMPPADGSA